jgi:hypothetical protein
MICPTGLCSLRCVAEVVVSVTGRKTASQDEYLLGLQSPARDGPELTSSWKTGGLWSTRVGLCMCAGRSLMYSAGRTDTCWSMELWCWVPD